MVLEKVPVALRGELTRWLIEVHSGVYIGHVSGMVRDRLWEHCSDNRRAGRILQAWTTNNEQHFTLRMAGDETRRVVEWEGVQLVEEMGCKLSTVEVNRIREEG